MSCHLSFRLFIILYDLSHNPAFTHFYSNVTGKPDPIHGQLFILTFSEKRQRIPCPIKKKFITILLS